MELKTASLIMDLKFRLISIIIIKKLENILYARMTIEKLYVQ